jgi:hypothetical protein
MKSRGWTPTRRNRNIGTAKSGRSKNNKLIIPERRADGKVFWERLSNPVFCPMRINGHQVTLAVEPPSDGYIHAITPHDVAGVLELIVEEHLKSIELLVLRQPNKKEEVLTPAWGRFVYYADLGRYSGPAVYLEAVKVGTTIRWSNKLTPHDRKELRSLALDGHSVVKIKRGYDIYTTPYAVRNTQLFRTIPHEIGHAVDYLSHAPSLSPSSSADDEFLARDYDSKPYLDKEEFANRYAREFYAKWTKLGVLPFDRRYEELQLKAMGLNPMWFCM